MRNGQSCTVHVSIWSMWRIAYPCNRIANLYKSLPTYDNIKNLINYNSNWPRICETKNLWSQESMPPKKVCQIYARDFKTQVLAYIPISGTKVFIWTQISKFNNSTTRALPMVLPCYDDVPCTRDLPRANEYTPPEWLTPLNIDAEPKCDGLYEIRKPLQAQSRFHRASHWYKGRIYNYPNWIVQINPAYPRRLPGSTIALSYLNPWMCSG